MAPVASDIDRTAAVELSTQFLDRDKGFWNQFQKSFHANSRQFLQRVYADGLGKYIQRLESTGLVDLDHVLDAGCGFGQWSLSLGAVCGRVTGLDISAERVAACATIADHCQVENCSFVVGSLEDMPIVNSCYDGILAYSSLYLTDYAQSIPEIARVLRPGGVLYLSTNGIGRFLMEVINRPNVTKDFDPRRLGLHALYNTWFASVFGRSSTTPATAISPRRLARLLEQTGFCVRALGGEGKVGKFDTSFVPSTFFRLVQSFDILAVKN